jgi:arsenite methyltransferase
MAQPWGTPVPAASTLDVEQAVRQRYSQGAGTCQGDLCMPVTYDRAYLGVIPQEILEKDYGCGDPTAYAEAGQTVLDLGSGAGKTCFILSQIVGSAGRVIGVDMNDDMLALAEKYRQEIGDAIGHHNVEFRKARIQNLRLDLRRVDAWLSERPVRSAAGMAELDSFCRRIEGESPLLADESVDLIVSNCVLNLVRPEDKHALFAEMYRVLRNGGRAVISDIVCDEDVPAEMQNDPQLWSGCISGAFREDRLLEAFAEAGFHGMQYLGFPSEPWQTVGGIEFRAVTASARKGKLGPCLERNQAVIYTGPWSAVHDDDGHRYPRGVRIAVCDKTFHLLKRGPYREQMVFIEPRNPIALEDAKPFDCARTAPRHARETKGLAYDATTAASSCCGTGGCS